MSEVDSEARADWEARVGRRRAAGGDNGVVLPAPQGVRALTGRGHVTMDWEPVDGAVGYLVLRGDSAGGPFEVIDHRGGDVLAVPHPPYADTTGEPGRVYHYAVTAIADMDAPGTRSRPVPAASTVDGREPVVRIGVRADEVTGPVHRPWREVIGSEHLSHLLSTETTGGRPIGTELTLALRLARSELGVRTVRAHAILNDDLGVYREVDGEPVHDFGGVDRVYDTVVDCGLRPVVELSFMPRDLASDPSKTVFEYGAIVSPPKDWDRWADLVRALVEHLVARYGLAEVRDHWAFEVWNEANLEVFWSGTREEYFRLYDLAARAVKDVDPGLRVGGPASAAAGWLGALLGHLDESGAPLDFLSTHTYGTPPLDLRPLCRRYGRPDLPLLWTEWGTTPTHFNPIGDDAFAAAFLLRGMHSAAGRIDGLAHWVLSDHFEELGRPPALFHGGFGLLTVGNLRKPRYWAMAVAERLGDEQLAMSLAGDGAGGLVDVWAARRADGAVGVLVWNLGLYQDAAGGAAALDREIELRIDGLPARVQRVRHYRIDRYHSNVQRRWESLGGGDWPTDEQWEVLRAGNVLEEFQAERAAVTMGGTLAVHFSLPMPGISYLELGPET
jgi:xylan 1,4-beta-xylosidase